MQKPRHLPVSDSQILAERLKMLPKQLPVTILPNLLLALMMVWVLYPQVTQAVLIGWAACIICLNLAQIFSLQRIDSRSFNENNAYRYTLRYIIVAFLSGCIWASAAFWLPYTAAEQQILVFVLLLSVAGSILSVATVNATAFYFYAYPILIACAAHAFLLGGHVWNIMGVITLVYAAYAAVTAWQLHHTLHQSTALQYGWQQTAGALEHDRETLSKQLEQHLSTEKEMSESIDKLKLSVRHLQQLATIDELTGIPNRRSFDEAIVREWSRARREKSSVALFMIDVDYFKSFNDLYLHQRGDEVLKQVAQTIKQFARRPDDIAARYGGEEFALILVKPTPAYVQQTAQAMLRRVFDLHIKHEQSDVAEYVTVSIGIAIHDAPDDGNHALLINAADNALYEAKRAGRNQMVIADDLTTHRETKPLPGVVVGLRDGS